MENYLSLEMIEQISVLDSRNTEGPYLSDVILRALLCAYLLTKKPDVVLRSVIELYLYRCKIRGKKFDWCALKEGDELVELKRFVNQQIVEGYRNKITHKFSSHKGFQQVVQALTALNALTASELLDMDTLGRLPLLFDLYRFLLGKDAPVGDFYMPVVGLPKGDDKDYTAGVFYSVIGH